MQTSLRSAQSLTLMLLIVLTAAQCEQSDSRRAVSEHQLMHDRGRNIQSLKRLIWLSSAMEGLHTAQSRSAANAAATGEPPKGLDLDLNPPLVQNPRAARVQNLLRDFFNNPYLNQLAEPES